MAKYYDRYIETPQYKVPIRIYVEVRKTVRASVGKDHIILRIPVFAAHDIDKHVQFAKTWLDKVIVTHPQILDRYHIQTLEDTYEFTVLDDFKYKVILHKKPVSAGSAKLNNYIFNITIPEQLDEFEQRKMVRQLLSKVLAKIFKQYVTHRVENFNIKYFKKKVKGVTLRYNTSNWGSCSTTGRINISTRALLLPLEAFDYIIVHELAHLVEMNHSDKFWKVVRDVMPDYERHEVYIKAHSHELVL